MQFLSENIRFLSSVNPGIFQKNNLHLLLDNELTDLNLLIQLSAASGYSIDRLLREDLAKRSKVPADLKLIIFDVDGVMTDGGMYYTESGDEFKVFNAKDGLAIKALKKAGFETGIISHGMNTGLIGRRAALLGISYVYAGDRPKEDVLSEWCNKLGITFGQTAFIGDDINDLPVMRIAGFTACPADAVEQVKQSVDVVLKTDGGKGCIREWVDQFLLPVDAGFERK